MAEFGLYFLRTPRLVNGAISPAEQVEAVFSEIKRKFGDSVRSKTDTATVNEVLCTVSADNVCVVNQEMSEVGITERFWDDNVVPDDTPRMVVPFRRLR